MKLRPEKKPAIQDVALDVRQDASDRFTPCDQHPRNMRPLKPGEKVTGNELRIIVDDESITFEVIREEDRDDLKA